MSTPWRSLAPVAVCGILTFVLNPADAANGKTAKGQTGIKGQTAAHAEHRVSGILEHVHRDGQEHGHIVVKVHAHNGRGSGQHSHEVRFTVGPHTRIETEGKGHHEHHGLHGLHHGEHVTIVAHGNHADVIIIHHHHKK